MHKEQNEFSYNSFIAFIINMCNSLTIFALSFVHRYMEDQYTSGEVYDAMDREVDFVSQRWIQLLHQQEEYVAERAEMDGEDAGLDLDITMCRIDIIAMQREVDMLNAYINRLNDDCFDQRLYAFYLYFAMGCIRIGV